MITGHIRKPCTEAALDIAVSLKPVMDYLYERGILSLKAFDQGLLMRTDAFNDMFPEFEKEVYYDDLGRPGYYAIGEYNGQKFFTHITEDD